MPYSAKGMTMVLAAIAAGFAFGPVWAFVGFLLILLHIYLWS